MSPLMPAMCMDFRVVHLASWLDVLEASAFGDLTLLRETSSARVHDDSSSSVKGCLGPGVNRRILLLLRIPIHSQMYHNNAMVIVIQAEHVTTLYLLSVLLGLCTVIDYFCLKTNLVPATRTDLWDGSTDNKFAAWTRPPSANGRSVVVGLYP